MNLSFRWSGPNCVLSFGFWACCLCKPIIWLVIRNCSIEKWLGWTQLTRLMIRACWFFKRLSQTERIETQRRCSFYEFTLGSQSWLLARPSPWRASSFQLLIRYHGQLALIPSQLSYSCSWVWDDGYSYLIIKYRANHQFWGAIPYHLTPPFS